MLNEAGVDHLLARHMAHLWTRDPLVIFGESSALFLPSLCEG